MKERTLYALLAMAFAVSRLIYYLFGVRFDALRSSTTISSSIRSCLRHRLFQSLLYLHIQPPGWNLYTGVGPEAFPCILSYRASHAIHLLLGLGICWSTLLLMRVFRCKPLDSFCSSRVVHRKSGCRSF